MKADTTIQIPTEAEVPALTDRLADIKAEIVKLKAEEKTLEARLELYALNQKGEHLGDEKREGRKVTLTGARWSLPVLFTSDLLIKSFKNESPKHRELRTVLTGKATLTEAEGAEADQQLKLFFDPPNTWAVKLEDGQKFRAACAEWLDEEVAAKFISACTQRDKHGVKKSNTAFASPSSVESAKSADRKEILS